MSETESERAAREWFGPNGFAVTRIEKDGDHPRADYRITDAAAEYILECKDKDDSPEYKAVVGEAAVKGAAYGDAPVLETNTISGIFSKAEKQLDATPTTPGAFRLVWFSSRGANGDFVAEQARRTLFGYTSVAPCPDYHTRLPERLCFYFGESVFHGHRGIDAVLLWNGRGVDLCVNNFSPRYDAFKGSKLYAHFRRPYDPLEAEKAGAAYVLDGPLDRRNQGEAQRALSKKYGWAAGVSVIAEVQQTGILLIPPSSPVA